MPISRWWRTNTLRSLKPCHCDWIKSVKVSKNFSLGSSTTENNDFRSCKNSWMGISWCGRSTWNFWFSELVCVNIKNVCIIEIGIPFCFSSKIMTTKDNYGSSRKSSWMTSSRTGTYTFNNWVSPLPSSYLKLSIWKLTWRLLRIWAFAFLSAFTTLRMALLMTIFWMLRFFHLLHIWTFLLLLLIFIWTVSLVRPVLLWVIWLIITLH